MNTTQGIEPVQSEIVPGRRRVVIHIAWQQIALVAILLLSAFLNFYRLNQLGFVNSYYEAGVKSMLMNWHNFFFVSFDPGGFVTIDKPPLGFWIQAASARLFGFNNFSLLLPEALAGLFAVGLLYYLVKRTFGPIAGLLAALALALSPISIATSRDTTIDTLLVLTILLAAWALSYAAESGRLRWLMLCAVLVGLGFNIKMLESYLVVPAFGLVYLLGAPHSWRVRILHLALATLVLIVVSFAWIITVDLTPVSQRPYVGSSGTNSELNLALGYNGLQRLTGRLAIFQNNTTPRDVTGQQSAAPTNAGQQPPAGFTQVENGAPGPLRLFNQQLGGQVGWLLPMALLGLLLAASQQGIRLPLNPRQQAVLMWGVWLLTMGIFFSVASFFHTYYTVMLVPSICALFGIGVVALWQAYRQAGWSGWLLPGALVGVAAVQAFLLSSYPNVGTLLTPIIICLSLLAAVGLSVMTLLKARKTSDISLEGKISPRPLRISSRTLLVSAATVGVLALLLAPAFWGGSVALQGRSFQGPGGAIGRANFTGNGPGNFGGNGARGRGQNTITLPNFRPNTTNNKKLEQYLLANQGNAQFILATASSMTASPLILNTGKPVMALGGFSGADDILTQQQLISLIEHGTVRFFLLPLVSGNSFLTGGRGGFGGSQNNNALTQWVNMHCATVPGSQWQTAGTIGSRGADGFRGGAQQLFDCANRR